jgi:hypothetical protein
MSSTVLAFKNSAEPAEIGNRTRFAAAAPQTKVKRRDKLDIGGFGLI